MKTWEICYALIPTNYNPQKVALVEAETEADARELLRDSWKKKGIHPNEVSIQATKEYTPPTVKGRVIQD